MVTIHCIDHPDSQTTLLPCSHFGLCESELTVTMQQEATLLVTEGWMIQQCEMQLL